MSSGFVPALAPRLDTDPSPLALPPAPSPAPRPGVPWLASAVPVVGALGLWAVTGSVFALWFAVLGPVIAVAGVLDGRRSTKRVRRAAAEEAAVVRARAGVQIDERHAAERAALRARHPDVAGYLRHPEQIWRAVPERVGTLVVGAGRVASAVRVTGGGGEEDAALVARAREVAAAPVTVALGSGIAVVGPPVLADAVVRALVLQLALAGPPGELALVGGETAWLRELPHAGAAAGFRVAVGRVGEGEGELDQDSELVIVSARTADALPPRCGTVIFLVSAAEARVEIGGDVELVSVEAISELQAATLANELAARASRMRRAPREASAVRLAELGIGRRGGSPPLSLSVPVGLCASAPASLDIVSDGPHAVVTGMTGAGKSELLVTWVVALCTAYDTSAVSFLLADFKGGTAFDALARLPHVTGVITDLDSRVARRAIESLRAELRHREAELARSGVRDIGQTDLPRLIIVIDEFAALRESHPELEALFTDIAARGRALGMHLIIGTQRAAGVLRDSLLANCPLRVSLRVADALDSRAVVGTDEAARLPGGAEGRGVAVVRRSADARTSRVRMALTDATDIAAVEHRGGAAPRRPWLPALPLTLDLADLPPAIDGALRLGLVDEPDHQRQAACLIADRALLVVGGVGAGKTTALRTLAAQVPRAARLWIGPDSEAAWDALAAGTPPVPGTTVFVDDVDALAGRLSGDYARAASEELERWIRGAGDLGIRIFASAQRLTGVAGRLADLFPRRLVLATASRADHLAAGGEGADFVADLPPGRGTLDRRTVQVAVTDAGDAPAAVPATASWDPPPGVTGYVVRHAPPGLLERWERTGVRLRAVDGAGEVTEAEPGGRVVVIGDPEQWMSHPRLLTQVRNLHVLVIDVSCAADYRLLTGDREPPPYCAPGRGRAWECPAGRRVRRVALTGALGA
ncbi:FtsK/SpoIIIE domain-containing protein [Microbacterium sp. P05]|uniref:FtsK/SpoIIIE domain-containing protein n=1 Tax=Microbacterium sp. P05 TaxID=3366948 RepID=UPI0037462410